MLEARAQTAGAEAKTNTDTGKDAEDIRTEEDYSRRHTNDGLREEPILPGRQLRLSRRGR